MGRQRTDNGLSRFPFRRLVVVSNRLPFAVEGSGKDLRLKRTVGGLVTATASFIHSLEQTGDGAPEVVWVGWPGPLKPGTDLAAVERLAAAQDPSAVPVFLDPAEVHGFYDGFSNRTLWPLFHLFLSYTAVDDAEWAAYRAVNARFRDAILEILRPGDVLWIHDYHLMLLPALVREASHDTPMAFFLHIPFPPFEVVRVLPDAWARDLVAGVLGADVVGLHTYDYVRHFLRSVERLLGVEHDRGNVDLASRIAAVDAYPIGIDFDRFDRAAQEDETLREMRRLGLGLGGRRAVLSVDRLDYTKGVLARLQAFETFLARHPEWRRRVSMIAVVVPSRVNVDLYRSMKTQIEETVGRVNGRFGDVDWTPVLYRYRALGFAQLAALYAQSDVALVTPLRDGMNLVAKEYLATRSDDSGVLVLSDTAGAARELGEAVIVNPYHVGGLVEAIETSLAMPLEEQRRRNRTMRERLRRYDVVRWGREQFARLATVRDTVGRRQERSLEDATRRRIVASYRSARRRLLFLDYDGTLTPLVRDPALAAPSPELLALLERVASDPSNQVVIASGRDGRTLEGWLGKLPVDLVAEHGMHVRRDGRWRTMASLSSRGKDRVRSMMQVFADRLPGSFIEEKSSSVAWHYRGADPDLGPIRCGELIEALQNLVGRSDLQILTGKKVVEVKPARVSKGAAAQGFIARARGAFILAAGDDKTDESLFAVLPAKAYSIRVGPGESGARFNVQSPKAFVALLAELADAPPPRARPRASDGPPRRRPGRPRARR